VLVVQLQPSIFHFPSTLKVLKNTDIILGLIGQITLTETRSDYSKDEQKNEDSSGLQFQFRQNKPLLCG
jgi:hypothetical protein